MRDLFGGKSSFTLPELIIAISILTILSLITIASYHHIVSRAKIAQLHSKCHVLSQRYIEFYTTNQRYPEDLVFIPPPTWGDGSIEWRSAFNAYNFFYLSLSKDLGQIFFHDPFPDRYDDGYFLVASSKEELNDQFLFRGGNKKGCVIVSRGPNLFMEKTPSFSIQSKQLVFDPTNGMNSAGDLFITIPENSTPKFCEFQ